MGLPALKSRSTIVLSIKLLVSLCLILFLFKISDPIELQRVARQLSAWSVVSSISLIILAYIIGGIRWWLCLIKLEFHELLRKVCAVRFVGQGLNVLLPGGVVGDLIQIGAVVGPDHLSYSRALATVIADRSLGFLAIVGSGTVLVFILGVHTSQLVDVVKDASYILLFMTLLAILATFFIVTNRRRIRVRFRYIINFFSRVLAALAVYRHHGITVLIVFVLGGLSALVLALALRILSFSFSEVPLAYTYIAIVAATLASLTPFTYGGAGVREIAFIGIFSHVGIGQAEGFVIAVAWFGVTMLTALVLTLIGFFAVDFRIAESVEAAIKAIENRAAD